MTSLHHIIGNVLEPIKKPAMIIHVCNDVGGFGKGFVVPLANKYPQTKLEYLKWYKSGNLKLGEVQFVQVEPNICVANMIAQHDIKWKKGIPPIRYPALKECLKKIYEKALNENYIVASPRIGCVLAGGLWEIVELIIQQRMTVETYIYTLENEKHKWPNTCYEN